MNIGTETITLTETFPQAPQPVKRECIPLANIRWAMELWNGMSPELQTACAANYDTRSAVEISRMMIRLFPNNVPKKSQYGN